MLTSVNSPVMLEVSEQVCPLYDNACNHKSVCNCFLIG